MFFLAAIIIVFHTSPPPAIKEPVVPSESKCDYAFDYNQKDAGDICVETADEWAVYGAYHSHAVNILFIDEIQALTRLQASKALQKEGRGSDAFGQMQLAVSISQEIGKKTSDRHIVQFINIIANEATKAYPKFFKFDMPKVP